MPKTKAKAKTKTKTIEERYKKKSQLEHILDRPDSYIGSIEMTNMDEPMWICDDNGQFIKKSLKIVPGLYKIFDEILVNAGDQWVRLKQMIEEEGETNLKPVKNIKIEIDRKLNQISVYNDGEGIDIALHQEHKMYVPQLLFGELLTSENYDDDENTQRLTGGKNGYGSKLTNIFSKEFTIETVDGNRKLKYVQTFKDNMSIAGKPKITKYSSRPYTKVSFIPDLEKFGMGEDALLDDDIVYLMKKRVYDLTAYTDKSVNVYLNGERLQTKMFEKYVDLYLGSKTETKRVYSEFNSRWEIVATVSPDDKFEHVSFVNGICTYKGGKHVDYIANQISKKMLKYLQSKGGKKNTELYSNLKTANIKDNLWIFVKAQINMPSFSSQTKEEMTTAVKNFGSKCDISEDFIKKLCKTKILEKAMMLSQYKQKSKVSKTDGKKKSRLSGIPKLDDANWAGTSKSQECTLILTEGDSAKALAVAGLSVVGSNKFGVFPLKGKLINPRGSSLSKNMKNDEMNNLKKILGLQMYESGTNKPKVYKDTSQLRYGHIMIFTDQDLDGSHIKGLVINMFAYYWPSLLQIDGFIQTLATPIIKVKQKGNSKSSEVKSFYTLYDYQNWKDGLSEDAIKKWHKPKYFKGLGTSTKKDAREYFNRYDEDIVNFFTEKKDFNKEIDLAFEQKGELNGKKYTDLRKKWLMDYDHSRVLDMNEKNLSYTRFIHDDLIHFSNYDNIRAIPSICDGLKPSQRKVLYGVFKRNLVSEIKVAQLGGYVSEQSAYHHGEASLFGTIIGMAQDYVGSNNINLLQPNGQFGTRAMGGKDSASPRYIFTQMSKITRKIFNKEDDEILTHLIDDGQQIEPKHYMPVIPMILVNGANGIGTGYSTNLPPFNITDIIHNLKVLLYNDSKSYKETDDESKLDCVNDDNDDENEYTNFVEMKPYYKGFKGEIEQLSINKFRTIGVFERTNDTTVTVTELPIGIWTQNYKEHLEKLQSDENIKIDKKTGKVKKSKKTKELMSYTNNLGLDNNNKKSKSKKKTKKLKSTEDDLEKINITLKFTKAKLDKHMKNKEKFMTTFKLVEGKSTKTSNMYLFDENNRLKKYKSALDILKHFYSVRIQYYKKRYNHLLNKIKRRKNILREKIRFIKGFINDEIKILKKTDEQILDVMIEHKFMKFDDNEDNDQEDDIMIHNLDSYKYLIDMSIRSLTKSKLKELRAQHKERKVEYKTLLKKSPKILWLDDLKGVEKCL